jgi:hypothetical protein
VLTLSRGGHIIESDINRLLSLARHQLGPLILLDAAGLIVYRIIGSYNQEPI